MAMAFTPKLLLRPSILFTLVVIVVVSVFGSATARPGCKTFFVYTANLPGRNPSLQVVEIEPKPAADFKEIIYRSRIASSDFHRFPVDVEKREIGHSLWSFGYSSFSKHSRDILNVVFGLLLGVVCGALTSATIYLIWSLLFHRGEHRNLDSNSSDDDDLYNPKKIGYVIVPAAPVEAAPKEAASGN